MILNVHVDGRWRYGETPEKKSPVIDTVEEPEIDWASIR